MLEKNKETLKVLVTGASGLVGSHVVPVMASRYNNLYVTTHQNSSNWGERIPIDLSKPDRVTIMLRDLKPDIIVNLAAMTDVDKCESEKQKADTLNRELSSILASHIAQAEETYLLHVSTDYVFDGYKGNYSEESKTNPINWYGKTKLAGEEEISTNVDAAQWCIARISTPFGLHQKKLSFPLFILNKLQKEERVKALDDQYTSPTYGPNLGIMLTEIVDHRIKGIIHIAGKDKLSRYQQAKIIADVFRLDNGLILKARIEDMGWRARRPRDSSLNVEKAEKTLDNKPQGFHEAIKDLARILRVDETTR